MYTYNMRFTWIFTGIKVKKPNVKHPHLPLVVYFASTHLSHIRLF